jgi:hypothetical protein
MFCQSTPFFSSVRKAYSRQSARPQMRTGPSPVLVWQSDYACDVCDVCTSYVCTSYVCTSLYVLRLTVHWRCRCRCAVSTCLLFVPYFPETSRVFQLLRTLARRCDELCTITLDQGFDHNIIKHGDYGAYVVQGSGFVRLAYPHRWCEFFNRIPVVWRLFPALAMLLHLNENRKGFNKYE